MNKQLTFHGSCAKIEKWSTKFSRLYVHVEGETILENLQNRRNRPHKDYATLIAPLLEMLGVQKVRWSQNAGCRCGCSPGFILDRKVFIDTFHGNDLFVTVNVAPKNDGNNRDVQLPVSAEIL